jgi:spermidine/putrescine-binding protein
MDIRFGRDTDLLLKDFTTTHTLKGLINMNFSYSKIFLSMAIVGIGLVTSSCGKSDNAADAANKAAAAPEEKVLNVYNWSDYIAPDTLANFEKETGIKVQYDVFDSNEILHAKLIAKNTGYDIVVPGSNWAKLQIDGGLF